MPILRKSGTLPMTALQGQEVVLAMIGCFNPPTVAHINLLASAKNLLVSQGIKVKKGYFIPTHGSFAKPGLAPPEDRVKMCEMLAKTTTWIEVDPYETLQEQWIDALTTLNRIKEYNSECHVLLVCGSDLVLRWNEDVWPDDEVRTILDNYGVVMSSRIESIEDVVKKVPVIEGHLQNVFMLKENPLREVSSSLVRRLLKEKKEICGLVLPDIERYVLEKKFYL